MGILIALVIVVLIAIFIITNKPNKQEIEEAGVAIKMDETTPVTKIADEKPIEVAPILEEKAPAKTTKAKAPAKPKAAKVAKPKAAPKAKAPAKPRAPRKPKA